MRPISSGIESDRGKYIPWIITAFFISFILPLVGFAWIAFTHKPSEVTANAYEKGLRYNDVLKNASKEKELGWNADITLTGNTVRFVLKDKANKPISNATVAGWLVRPTEKSLDSQFTLKELAAGLYEARVNLPAKGLWEIRVTAESQDNQFQASKTFVVP